MTDVQRLPPRSDVEHEASEWIARLEAEDVSDADREQFELWKTAHPLNNRIYEEMRATWSTLAEAGPLVRAVSFGQAMARASRPRPQGRRWALAAAAVAAVVAIGVWWGRAGQSSESFQTAIGEHATVTLPDGSTVDLDADGLARVEYSRRARVVRLERGEAYFTVSHDTRRPFWVLAGGSWVRAVGTAFNVEIRPDRGDVQVTVSEGTVKVGPALPNRYLLEAIGSQTAAATLSAGQQVDLQGRRVVLREVGASGALRFTAWRTGTLYFENQPLDEVIAELSRHTLLKIIVRDPQIGRLPVGGSFQASTRGAEALLTTLQEGFDLPVDREGDHIYIGAKPIKPDVLPEAESAERPSSALD